MDHFLAWIEPSGQVQKNDRFSELRPITDGKIERYGLSVTFRSIDCEGPCRYIYVRVLIVVWATKQQDMPSLNAHNVLNHFASFLFSPPYPLACFLLHFPSACRTFPSHKAYTEGPKLGRGVLEDLG